jgi:hypothetical protein
VIAPAELSARGQLFSQVRDKNLCFFKMHVLLRHVLPSLRRFGPASIYTSKKGEGLHRLVIAAWQLTNRKDALRQVRLPSRELLV